MSRLAPTTLTDKEMQKLLAASASKFRNHVSFSIALATGLRLAELVGLNIGNGCVPISRSLLGGSANDRMHG